MSYSIDEKMKMVEALKSRSENPIKQKDKNTNGIKIKKIVLGLILRFIFAGLLFLFYILFENKIHFIKNNLPDLFLKHEFISDFSIIDFINNISYNILHVFMR